MRVGTRMGKLTLFGLRTVPVENGKSEDKFHMEVFTYMAL